MFAPPIPLTTEELVAAREWIADCQWPDLDPEDIDDLTPVEVERAIRIHYEGGIKAFIEAA